MRAFKATKISELLAPMLSLALVILGLAVVALTRTQERHLGYEVLALHRQHRLAAEEKKRQVIELAKLSRPQHVETVAQRRFDLKRVQKSQIIRMRTRSLN